MINLAIALIAYMTTIVVVMVAFGMWLEGVSRRVIFQPNLPSTTCSARTPRVTQHEEGDWVCY